jgi:hypothetical protein
MVAFDLPDPGGTRITESVNECNGEDAQLDKALELLG